MTGEGVAEFLALFVSEISEKRIGDDMVGGAKVVDALKGSAVGKCGPC